MEKLQCWKRRQNRQSSTANETGGGGGGGDDDNADLPSPTQTRSTETDNSQSIHDNPYKAVGLSSPPRGKDALPLSQATTKIKSDGFWYELVYGNEETKAMLYFLYGGKFLQDLDKQVRKKYIRRMIKRGSEARKRLRQVLRADGDINLSQNKTFRNIFAATIVTIKRYFEQPNTTGFLKDMEQAKIYLRRQLHGNCYLQGPVIMLSYLLQNRCSHDAAPFDVSKYIRRHFTDDMFLDYVMRDKGGNSIGILADLVTRIGQKPEFFTVAAESFGPRGDYNLTDLIDKYGPGLVSGFRVHKNFQRFEDGKANEIGYHRFHGDDLRSQGNFFSLAGTEDHQLEKDLADLKNAKLRLDGATRNSGGSQPTARVLFQDEPTPNGGENAPMDGRGKKPKHEYHAMVLIGVRKEGKKEYLLLQNWWSGLQVVEVSWGYFRASDAMLTFFTGKISNPPASLDSVLSVNNAPIAECNNLDKCEDPSEPAVDLGRPNDY